jgi:hypothetical protein
MTTILAMLSISLLFAIYVIIQHKKDNLSLMKLNNIVSEQITELRAKNSSLWADINKLSHESDEMNFKLQEILNKQEKVLIEPGLKVKWIDKSGEEEFGIVYDSFNTSNNHLVVVRGLKKNKPTGRYFTVGFDKITIID